MTLSWRISNDELELECFHCRGGLQHLPLSDFIHAASRVSSAVLLSNDSNVFNTEQQQTQRNRTNRTNRMQSACATSSITS